MTDDGSVEDEIVVAPAPGAESVVDLPEEQGAIDFVEQGVADPVRLDDTSVERIIDADAAGDELEVGPRPVEAGSEVAELGERRHGERRLGETGAVVGSAIPQLVGRQGVAGEETGPVDLGHALTGPLRTAAAMTSATPHPSRPSPAIDGTATP